MLFCIWKKHPVCTFSDHYKMASPIKLLQNEGARHQISNLEGAQLRPKSSNLEGAQLRPKPSNLEGAQLRPESSDLRGCNHYKMVCLALTTTNWCARLQPLHNDMRIYMQWKLWPGYFWTYEFLWTRLELKTSKWLPSFREQGFNWAFCNSSIGLAIL